MNKLSSTFTLNLQNVSRIVDNTYYFDNINIRDLLGDLYNKYDRFKLVLTASSGYNGRFPAEYPGYNSRSIKLFGFDWLNVNEVSVNRNTYTPNIIFPNQGGSVDNLQSNIGFIFSKPSNTTGSFFFKFHNINTAPAISDPRHFIVFTIYGVEETPSIPPTIMSLSSTFILNSNDATINTNNNGGILTFKNFKIMECLGKMYDKYDKFKLVLNSFTNYNTETLTNVNRLIAVKMRGLNFINVYDYSPYSYSYPNPYTDAPTLGMVNMASAGFSQQQTQANWGCVFSKPSNTSVDLTIYLYTIQNSFVFTDRNYGITSYTFSIYGIK